MKLKIREYRERMGISQRELAKRLGKAVGTIQSWEREDSYPNAENVWDLCELFDTTPNELIGWYDEFPQQENEENGKDELKPAFVTLKVNTDGSVELVEKAD